MDDDFDFNEMLEECGIDANEFNAHSDSGMAMGFGAPGRAPYFNPTMVRQHYEDVFDEQGYAAEDDAAFSFAAQQQPSMQQYTNNNEYDDDIEQYLSSDPYAFGPSSPTPSHPRSFVVPASQQQPAIHRSAASQPQYSQPFSENRSQGYAYMHVADGAPPRGVKNDINHERQPTGSQQQQAQASARGSNPRNAYNLRLRPVSQLPDIYRGIFKFGVFNAVQSKCYETIMETKQNMVVSAPTGGGKTVLFELGVIEMLIVSGHHSAFKCVYVAPTKALCSERTRDWTAKFEPLGIKCCEMTGDTVQMGKSAWTTARGAKIIITTSEKWDSLTRSWHDHGDFLSEIKLFLVDEVHVLNESRGSTLEVVISRMKAQAHDIRFMLVSATVPNIRDIADWVGNPSIDSNASATVYEFGEEFRPCKITRHIYGYPRKNQNDFQFSRTLDYKLYSVIQQHACSKPILVFCSTRKGVLTTAEQLLKEYEEAITNRQTTPWTQPKHLNRTFHDKRLEKLAKAGVGVHHAGLSLDDRRATEELYLDGSLRVVCATSTLAVGVNLPAHTVIIKGVKLYVTNGWQEYSDLDVVQMIGRAGRPQFDKEGIAIILCEQELEHKYKNIAQGKTILESSLHQNLLEHINSEIGIGAINDVQSAKDWLRNSFLRQRIQKNPGHYHIGKSAGQTWEEKMDDMVMQAVKKLETNELISSKGEAENAELSVTDYGEIMSKYYIRQSTMGSILKLTDRPSVRDILEVISCAEELGDVRLRGGDKQVYNKMRDHPDIRYKIKKVEKASDKSFILIQAVLGGISLSAPEYKTSDSQPTLDALSVFRHTSRIARVVVEVAIVKRNGAQLKHGLELVRCLTAKAWEDRPVVLKQIESIGEKSLKVLAEHGITSLQSLRKQEPSRIELLLNRRSPYGHEVLSFVQDMPQYVVSVTVPKNGITSYSGKKPVSIDIDIECSLVQPLSGRVKSKQKSKFPGMTSILTTTSDLDLIDFRRIATKVLKDSRSFSVTAELTKPSQSVCVLISAENFAGLTVTQSYKPSIPAKDYPTLDTHPKSASEAIVDDYEQDPDFWKKMAYNGEGDDDDELELTQKSGLTAHSRPPLEPKALPNGNYACNHNCKDKSACRHLCCREGTAKPPPPPKKHIEEKKGTQVSSNTAPMKGGDPPQKKSKLLKEDNSLANLEALHKRTGNGNSLRLGEGQRLKLDDDIAPRKRLQMKKPDFNLNLVELKDDDGRVEESDDDMPDMAELLASTTQPKKKTKNTSSETDYSNSELDSIMLAVDTTNSPSVSIDKYSNLTPATLNKTAKTHTLKRKLSGYDSSSNLSSPTLTAPSTKKSKLHDDSQFQTNEHALFLHNSSPSPAPYHNHSYDPFDNDTEPHDAHEDDYFAIDESIFNLVPSTSTAPTKGTPTGTASNTTMSAYRNAGAEAGAKELAQNEGKEQEQVVNDDQNDWADMEDWLLNSSSVQIIG